MLQLKGQPWCLLYSLWLIKSSTLIIFCQYFNSTSSSRVRQQLPHSLDAVTLKDDLLHLDARTYEGDHTTSVVTASRERGHYDSCLTADENADLLLHYC